MENRWTALEREDRTNGITVHNVSEFNANELRSQLQFMLADHVPSVVFTTNHNFPGLVCMVELRSLMPLNTMLSQQTLVTHMVELLMVHLKEKLQHIHKTARLHVSLGTVFHDGEEMLSLQWSCDLSGQVWDMDVIMGKLVDKKFTTRKM